MLCTHTGYKCCTSINTSVLTNQFLCHTVSTGDKAVMVEAITEIDLITPDFWACDWSVSSNERVYNNIDLQIFLDRVTFDKICRFEIVRGSEHFSKSCREGGSLQDVKVNKQTLTPGLTQVSCSGIYPLNSSWMHTYTDYLCFYNIYNLLFITEVCQSHSGSSASTKILYFTGKSPTPSMINIPKRLVCVCLLSCFLSEMFVAVFS